MNGTRLTLEKAARNGKLVIFGKLRRPNLVRSKPSARGGSWEGGTTQNPTRAHFSLPQSSNVLPALHPP